MKQIIFKQRNAHILFARGFKIFLILNNMHVIIVTINEKKAWRQDLLHRNLYYLEIYGETQNTRYHF